MRRWLGPLLAVVLLAGCSGEGAERRSAVYDRGERAAAPQLTGDLLDGGRYDLGARRGTVVVVNFWASWCAPCRDEVAELAAAYEATKGDGVDFLGINVRDERDKATAFLTSFPLGYPSLFDPAGESAMAFAVAPNTIPATLVIDRDGRIAAVFRKALLREELEPVIRAVAAEG